MPKYTPKYCESLLAANPQACAGLYDRIMRGKVIADVADHTEYVLRALKDGPKSAIPVAVWCRSNGDPGMEGELARRICDRLVRESKAFKDGQVYSVAAVEAEQEIQPTETIGKSAAIPAASNYDVEVSVCESLSAAPAPRIQESGKTLALRRMSADRMEPIVWPDILKRCADLEIGTAANFKVPAGKHVSAFARDIRGRLQASTTKLWLWNVAQLGQVAVSVTKRGDNPKVAPKPEAERPDPETAVRYPTITNSLLAAVSHIDVEIAALQDAKIRLIEMAQRFQETI